MPKPILLSLFDFTGTWAKPYIDAGWRVLLWDKEIEGCILEGFSNLYTYLDEILHNNRLDGLLAAPPCTDTSGSGARWWPEKDSGVRWWDGIEPGDRERIYFDSSTEMSITLIRAVLVLVDWYKPKFWALEQPVGRAEKLVPELKPFRKMLFNPCDYGDPYTKKTILWGEFNTDLPRTPVEPTEGSKMHKIPPGKNRKAIRSATPLGFAKAFYKANNFCMESLQ